MTSSNDDAAASPTPPLMADSNSPWGSGGNDDTGGGDKPKGSPWLPPTGRGGGNGSGPRRPGGLDDMLRRGPFGPQMPKLPGGRNAWALIGGGFVALWIAFTSIHQLSAGEEGVVTRLGSYSRTLGPGIQLTLPSPIERMQEVSTLEIRPINIPEGDGQNLVLTGDANIINLAYTVRWRVRDPERYLFQLENADGTVKDAAESAMRATIANFTLAQAIGSGRDAIETQVKARLQAILDGYNSGIRIEGIAVRGSAAPAEVEEAFNRVNAAQQRSEGFLNEARGYASRVVAGAEGDAAAFDRIYEQYRLAPEVTRRRLYYETMEVVLERSEKTVVDSGGVIPYMALPEARRRSPQPATPATPAPAANQGARP